MIGTRSVNKHSRARLVFRMMRYGEGKCGERVGRKGTSHSLRSYSRSERSEEAGARVSSFKFPRDTFLISSKGAIETSN